jgi:hypothetical protein
MAGNENVWIGAKARRLRPGRPADARPGPRAPRAYDFVVPATAGDEFVGAAAAGLPFSLGAAAAFVLCI